MVAGRDNARPRVKLTTGEHGVRGKHSTHVWTVSAGTKVKCSCGYSSRSLKKDTEAHAVLMRHPQHPGQFKQQAKAWTVTCPCGWAVTKPDERAIKEAYLRHLLDLGKRKYEF